MPHLTIESLSATLEEHRPTSLGELRKALEDDMIEFEEEELVGLLRQLGAHGRVLFDAGGNSFFRFLGNSRQAGWVYLMVAASIVESVLVLTSPETAGLPILRAILGVFILGFAPGYALTRALFPKRDLTILERVLMSIFLSLVVSIAIGTVLGAFLLFQALLNTLILGAITILLALLGAYRTFRTSTVLKEEG